MKFLVVLFLAISLVSGYKVLIYSPKFGKSHVIFRGKIADILANAGNDVVIYQPILDENITFSGATNKNIRYYFMPKNPNFKTEFFQNHQTNLWGEESWSGRYKIANDMIKIKGSFCELVLRDSENLKKLEAENFDLAITEQFEQCGYGIFKLLKIKTYITVTSTFLYAPTAAMFGIKFHPTYIPSLFGVATSGQMTFYQRVYNFVAYFGEVFYRRHFCIEHIIAKYVPDFDIQKATTDSAMFFINSDEYIDYPMPLTPKFVYIGGLETKKPKPLENKYRRIFDSSKKGVIMISFGSIMQADSMPLELKDAFLEAFTAFPEINFLWKYENDDISNATANVFTQDWIPQSDLLNHPRLLAFICHGGMNSLIEGATKGVPMIIIPLVNDQKRNSQMLVNRGTSLALNKAEITTTNLIKAIKEITENPKYQQNARKISKMMKSKPLLPQERIVKYSNFVAEFGNEGISDAEGRHQSFFVLHSFDVICFLLACLILAIVVLLLTVRITYVIFKRKLFLIQKKKVL